MTTRKEDWNEVADAIERLALKLQLHAEQVPGTAKEDVKNAFEGLAQAVDRGFDALRAAVQDPAVKDDVKDVAVQLSDALSNSISDLTSKFERRSEEDASATG